MISNRSSTPVTSTAMGFTNCTNNEIFLGAGSPMLVLEASERRYAAFINNSDADITLVLASKEKAKLNKGIILKAFGGSFEINQNNLYWGEVSAVAAKKCNLSFVECS
jgi:hypothetical protein